MHPWSLLDILGRCVTHTRFLRNGDPDIKSESTIGFPGPCLVRSDLFLASEAFGLDFPVDCSLSQKMSKMDTKFAKHWDFGRLRDRVSVSPIPLKRIGWNLVETRPRPLSQGPWRKMANFPSNNKITGMGDSSNILIGNWESLTVSGCYGLQGQCWGLTL